MFLERASICVPLSRRHIRSSSCVLFFFSVIMAQFWFYILSLTTVSSCMAIFTGGEQDVGSPLRVAQCRATCLERVSSSSFTARI